MVCEPPPVIDSVTALAITCTGCVAEGPVAGAILLVGLPATRAWEGLTQNPDVGSWYVEEEYVPGTSALITGPQSGGLVEETGLYVLHVNGRTNDGPLALHKVANALLALYAPGSAQTLSDGSILRVRGDIGPTRGQLLEAQAGWSTVIMTIPWRCYVNNPL